MHIKTNDTVEVITGDDKGQRGKVLSIDRRIGRIVVEGVNRVYKHMKRSQKNPQGGRLSKEMPIDVSNCMLIDAKTDKPTRVGVRVAKDGSRERYAKASGASLGTITATRRATAK